MTNYLVKCVRLKKNGTVSECYLNDKIMKDIENKQEIYTYSYKKNNLIVFGYDDGNPGQENKHELPEPLDHILLFNDSYMVYYNKTNDNPINFTKEMYRDFIEEKNKGFDTIGSEDTWSTEEELSETDSLNDFIVSDSTE